MSSPVERIGQHDRSSVFQWAAAHAAYSVRAAPLWSARVSDRVQCGYALPTPDAGVADGGWAAAFSRAVVSGGFDRWNDWLGHIRGFLWVLVLAALCSSSDGSADARISKLQSAATGRGSVEVVACR